MYLGKFYPCVGNLLSVGNICQGCITLFGNSWNLHKSSVLSISMNYFLLWQVAILRSHWYLCLVLGMTLPMGFKAILCSHWYPMFWTWDEYAHGFWNHQTCTCMIRWFDTHPSPFSRDTGTLCFRLRLTLHMGFKERVDAPSPAICSVLCIVILTVNSESSYLAQGYFFVNGIT